MKIKSARLGVSKSLPGCFLLAVSGLLMRVFLLLVWAREMWGRTAARHLTEKELSSPG